MNAMMGKIVAVAPPAARGRGSKRLAIQFKPTVLLPERTEVPAWLVDQVLTVQRVVADAREVGGPGDAIALAPGECERWLEPLVTEPAQIGEKLPKSLLLTLRWWKNQSPPPFTVSALGKTITGKFARRGETFTASVPTRDLLDGQASRPVEIEITCDTLRAICAVVSAGEPGYHRFSDARGQGYRINNPWYAADLVSAAGGGIIGLRENGRGVDHFAVGPETQKLLDKAGHSDRVIVGAQNKLEEAKLAFTMRQHAAGETRLEIEGVIDEGKNVRSCAAYRLLDHLPLLVIRRDARILEGKPDEKKKELTDSLVPIQLGFRCASMIEGDGRWGSQLVAIDGDRLGVIRACFASDFAQRGDWFLKAGWAMLHHPLRREVLLYLVDAENAPDLVSWAGNDFFTLEPVWQARPYQAPAGASFTVALSAGEIGGASLEGAWVACRSGADAGGVRCAAIARVSAPAEKAVARFVLGREVRESPLQPLFVEGIGDIHYAVAHFPKAKRSDLLNATVAGIPSRGEP